MTETVTDTMTETRAERAVRLADTYGLPSHNLQGDPLTTCTGCGVVIYAVAELCELREQCSGCRGVR